MEDSACQIPKVALDANVLSLLEVTIVKIVCVQTVETAVLKMRINFKPRQLAFALATASSLIVASVLRFAKLMLKFAIMEERASTAMTQVVLSAIALRIAKVRLAQFAAHAKAFHRTIAETAIVSTYSMEAFCVSAAWNALENDAKHVHRI